MLVHNYRITPACAGKTSRLESRAFPAEDHPRMCGKDNASCISLSKRLGSPPHVRERRRHSNAGSHAAGITPACAGKTQTARRSAFPIWDHPRMCGKDAMIHCDNIRCKGSPPHVRERLRLQAVQLLKCRITPACAGKTKHSLMPDYDGQDHPRMCGKDFL